MILLLQVKDLTKRFKNITAVKGISFEVAAGEAFGLLGVNGAGKTTTLRILSTSLAPTSGTALVCGEDTVKNAERVRSSVGVLFGGDTGLYERLTARENIEYFGRLHDMPETLLKQRIKELADIFSMGDYINRRVGSFSRGMRQKTAFARSIVHNPQVMLFDEPTSGLDIAAAQDVVEFIRACKRAGKTIVLSSHNLAEVEQLCDRVGFLRQGELPEQGTIPQLLDDYKTTSLTEVFLMVNSREVRL